MKWLVLFLFGIPSAYAGGITPSFSTGQMESSSSSKTIVVETIVTENYRTGYSYSLQGHNIQVKDGTVISPDATYTNTQTINGVNFNWTSPSLETTPRFEIVNEGQPFSLVETMISPGLETITNVTRTITTSTTVESISVFGQ